MNDPTPNPGSPAAVQLGCTCPRIDNGHGRPEGRGDGRFYYITIGCPVHSPEEKTDDPS